MSETAHNQRLRFDAQVTAPRQARVFLAAACAAWRAERFLEPASLVLSELVSNAVVHAGTEVDVLLRLDDGALLVSVHDTSSDMPKPGVPDAYSIGGHGLDIVSRLSESWGVAPDAEGGKSVWCVLRVDE